MRNQHAIIVIARTPEVSRSGSGDPFAALPWEDLDAVYHGCAGDIVERAAAVPETDVLVYRDARFPAEKLSDLAGDNVRVFDLQDGPIGEAVQQAVDGAFLEFYHRVLVVLENNPLLGTERLAGASDQLGVEDDCAVVIPADTGGVVAVALKAGLGGLFSGNSADSGSSWAGVLPRLCAEEMMLFPLRPSFPLDSTAGIERLRTVLAESDPDGPSYPKRTAAAIRAIEKKYRWKRGRT